MPDVPSFLPYAPLLIFGIFAILAIILGIISSQAEKKRSAELALFAQSAGLQTMFVSDFDSPYTSTWFPSLFSDSSTNYSILDRFNGFQPFGEGHSIRMRNLMAGSRDGLDWYMFDYYYTVGSGKNSTSYHYAITAARVPMTFPQLTLKPENLLTEIGEHLGLRELKFEVDEFNRRYFVTCSDEKRAYDILCPQTIEFLMGFPPRWWQLGGTYIVIAQMSPLRAELCYEVMQEITGFVSKIPNYVRQDIGFQPQWTGALD
jgi:hypothetical protein